MVEFEARLKDFAEINASVYAFSTDPEERASETVEKYNITLPVLYGVDGPGFVESHGAYYEERRNILHTTSFVLKNDRIMSLTLSSGPIGRVTAEDAIRYITYQQKVQAKNKES